ncbi:hypothetical protein [Streptomyces sp. NBC_01353]|uniref:hypothetical protein n=1 Tax=Streptomyces sp. NBC_01353 TaxID=2903835 RepID=UPI002E31F0CB|nr:hypothetical protein [Streptomyces sp. NBC_01353]
MIIVYTPAEGEVEHFDARSLRVSEVAIVSRTIDQPLSRQQLHTALSEEDLDVLRGVAWVIKKRGNPSLRFGDFDPGFEEMCTRIDRKEAEQWAEATAQIAWQQPDATPETVLARLLIVPATALDREHAQDVIKRLAKAPKEDPDPSLSSGTSGPAEISPS